MIQLALSISVGHDDIVWVIFRLQVGSEGCLVTIAGMGAPTVSIERLATDNESIWAIQAMYNIYTRGLLGES